MIKVHSGESISEQPNEHLDSQVEGEAQLQLVSTDDQLAMREEMQLQPIGGIENLPLPARS